MKVVEAVTITPARLVSTNVPEDDAPTWVAGTYAAGAEVMHNLHLFRSAADGNTAIPGAETTTVIKWVDLGPINRWRMFDKRIGNRWQSGTFTRNPESIAVTLQAGTVVNSIGLVGVSGASVQVIMTSPAEGVVYDKTINMAETGVTSWYDYFFMPFWRRDNLALLDLPPYGNAQVQIIVSAPGSIAAIGTLVIGYGFDIGAAVYGTAVNFESYSGIKEDEFGNVEIIPRGARDIVEFDVRIDTKDFSQVRKRLMRLRDKPSLYVGHPSMDATIAVGRFEGLNIVIANPAVCETSLEVRSIQ